MKIRSTKLGATVIVVNLAISLLTIAVPFFFKIDQMQNETILSTLFFTPLSCLAIATDFYLFRELRFLLLSGNILLVCALVLSACNASDLMQHVALFIGNCATMLMLNGTIILLPGREKSKKDSLYLNEWKRYR